MRQGLREKCRRVTAGVLTFVMVSMLALGDAGVALASEYGERFYQDGSSVVDEDEYSDTVSTKASFKNHKENGVTISVSASDDSDFRAGGEVYLDVHVKNESSGVIEDGILNFQGRKLKDSGAYFEEEPEDAITEGIMANEREEEEEEPGSEEEELINDLAPEVSEEAPVHMESSEAEGQQSTEGAESESAAEAEAGSEIGTESEAAAEGETGTEWRAEAESGEEAAAEGGSKIENEIAAEGEAETEAEARDDGDPVIKSGDAMQAVAGTAEAGAGEDKTEAATEAIPEEMSVAQENLVMQEDSSAGENEAANGPAAQESAAVESAAASPEEAGPGLQARSAVEETKGTIPAEMPAPEESRGSEDEDWFENEDGERRNEIVAGDTQKRKKSREDDEEEDDGPLQELTDIRLEPGQIYSARFVYTIDESLENAKNQKVVFRFSGKDEKNQNISQHEMFYYTANYLNAGEVRFKDGNRVRTGDEVVMGIHTSVYDFDILLGDDEVLAELASRSDAEKASPSNAQKADASNAEKASPSDAQEATPSNIEEDDIYTDPDEAEEDNEEDEEEEENDDFTVDLGNTSYKIEMINARLNGFKARKALVEDVNDNMLICTYRVSKEVKPGIYFGKIIQESKVKGKTFKSSQGFALIVTGSGEVELKGGIDGAEVQVKGPVESFPDGDVLSLKVSEVPVEKKALVEAALEQKAQETGISVNKLRALDIKVISDGEERELQGDVSVTFSNVELQPLEEFVETAGAAAIAEEEQGVAETVAEEEEGGFSLFGMRRMSRMRAAAPEAEEQKIENETERSHIGEGDGGDSSDIAVWHLDEAAGMLNDMDGVLNENGDVVMGTNHFSIFIIVNVADGQKTVPVTIKHFAIIREPEIVAGNRTYIPHSLKEQEVIKQEGAFLYPGAKDATGEYNESRREIYSQDVIELPNGGGTGIGYSILIDELSKLSLGGNYTIKEVTIKNANYPSGITVSAQSDNEIYLSNTGNEIEIEYEKTSGTIRGGVEFHDYNVSVSGSDLDGDKVIHTVNTKNQGINASSLCEGTGNRIGIGIRGLGDSKVNYEWSGETGLRQGIVSDTLNEGLLQFNSRDPGLFSRGDIMVGDVVAKKYITDHELEFKREGDTYTLQSVYQNGNSEPVCENLDKLKYTGKNWNKTKNLYSNLFWPLDRYEYEGREQLFPGGSKEYGERNDPNGNGTETFHGTSGFPNNDETRIGVYKDHNWFFGMRYDFEFTLGDYIGPLDYYFRGDDDFWLYIDDNLVKDVDLGGIHSAEGAYVNLKTYLESKNAFPKDTDTQEEAENKRKAKHTMSVFFIERGGTGSCCFMQFTLPNSSPIPVKEAKTLNKTVTKIWQDGGNEHNTRPNEIFVQLLQNGKPFGNIRKLSEENNWSYTWENLPEFRYVGSSERNQYTVKEIKVPGYDSSINQTDFTITNIETTYLGVEKRWVDSNNQYGTRPPDIQIQLYKKVGNSDWKADGDPVTLRSNTDSTKNWKYGWQDKPLYEKVGSSYEKVEYKVEELNGNWLIYPGNPDGWYNVGYSGDQQNGFVITNTYNPKYTAKSVEKIWQDDENKFGLRPTELEVQILQDGQPYPDEAQSKAKLNAAGGWKYSWNELPRYKYSMTDGVVCQTEYKYTISELPYENQAYYQVTYSPEDTSTNVSVIITNILQTAKFRVAKRINNIESYGERLELNDLAEDEFIVEVKEVPDGKGFSTGLVLKHAADSDAGVPDSTKISKYIIVPVTKDGILYDISEIIPKEYTPSSTFLTMVNTTDKEGNVVARVENNATEENPAKGTIRVKPGADAVVIVHNEFDHRDYFHHDARADNDFSAGVPSETDSEIPETQKVEMSAVLPGQDREKQLDEEERLM